MHSRSYTSTPESASRLNIFSAWLVHVYTASGAVAAFFAVAAVLGGRYRDAFLWMIAATVIDATDGVLARLARVKEVLPTIDGSKIDDLVDYVTFVFLPVFLLHHSGALPAGWGWAVAAAVLVSSLFGFSAVDAKTEDHFFTGFPSYWNIVALYLHLFRLDPIVNAVILVLLSAAVFWRVRYVYPSRTPVLRSLTMVLGAAWTIVVIVLTLRLPAISVPLVITSLFFPVYYFALSAVLNVRTAQAAR